jgi:short-subunit dehydrogenase
VVQPFLKNTTADLERYVHVNVETPLQLSHAFCSHHSGQPADRKGLILMSSMAGLWGTQYLAPYGATKAFNHILAESLYNELHAAGFDILACIAGATETPGYLASRPKTGRFGPAVMRPETLVRSVFKALGKKPYVVPGLGNKIAYSALTHLLPRRMALAIMNSAVGNRYLHLK